MTAPTWSAEATPNAVAVLELARIAAYCTRHTPTQIRAEIDQRVAALAAEPVDELTRLGIYAHNHHSMRSIRTRARTRIAAMKAVTL